MDVANQTLSFRTNGRGIFHRRRCPELAQHHPGKTHGNGNALDSTHKRVHDRI